MNTVGLRICLEGVKCIAEMLGVEHERMHGAQIRMELIFNTCCLRNVKDHLGLLSNSIEHALRVKHLSVYGQGCQMSRFCYLADLIECVICLMKGDHCGPINLGNPGEFTILQLAKLVRAKVNPQLELIEKPLPQDELLQRQPVIDLALRELGWQATVTLEHGPNATIAYFKEALC